MTLIYERRFPNDSKIEVYDGGVIMERIVGRCRYGIRVTGGGHTHLYAFDDMKDVDKVIQKYIMKGIEEK